MPENAELTFTDLAAANELRQQEWDPRKQLTLLYFSNALAGEVGEACNVVKKLERDRLGLRGSHATIAELAEELADVVIYAALLAARANIDLGQAVIDKFNATSDAVGMTARLPLIGALTTNR